MDLTKPKIKERGEWLRQAGRLKSRKQGRKSAFVWIEVDKSPRNNRIGPESIRQKHVYTVRTHTHKHQIKARLSSITAYCSRLAPFLHPSLHLSTSPSITLFLPPVQWAFEHVCVHVCVCDERGLWWFPSAPSKTTTQRLHYVADWINEWGRRSPWGEEEETEVWKQSTCVWREEGASWKPSMSPSCYFNHLVMYCFISCVLIKSFGVSASNSNWIVL